jgi:NADPH:quinone reductase-like Zn-dependent oxidoreductase
MLDMVGSRSLSDCRRALTPRGTYVVVGVANLGRWFGLSRQAKVLLLSPFVRQRMRVFVVRRNSEDLAVLKDLVEAGTVAPVIDRRYTLSEVPDALRRQGEGHAQGKIVIAASDAKRRPNRVNARAGRNGSVPASAGSPLVFVEEQS